MSLCALVVAARTAAMDAVFQYLTARTDPQWSICLWLRLQAHNSLNHTATHAWIAYTHSVLCIAGAAQQCCYLRVFFSCLWHHSREQPHSFLGVSHLLYTVKQASLQLLLLKAACCTRLAHQMHTAWSAELAKTDVLIAGCCASRGLRGACSLMVPCQAVDGVS